MRYEGDDADTIVAGRVFERDDRDVVLLVHSPLPDPKPGVDADPDDPPWRCRYTLHFPGDETRRSSVLGVGSMREPLLAIGLANNDLRYGRCDEGRRAIRWFGKDDLDLTFPVYD